MEAVAARSGWQVVKIYENVGISGATGRVIRRGLDALLRTANTKEFDLVAAWSADRLQRFPPDLNLRDSQRV